MWGYIKMKSFAQKVARCGDAAACWSKFTLHSRLLPCPCPIAITEHRRHVLAWVLIKSKAKQASTFPVFASWLQFGVPRLNTSAPDVAAGATTHPRLICAPFSFPLLLFVRFWLVNNDIDSWKLLPMKSNRPTKQSIGLLNYSLASHHQSSIQLANGFTAAATSSICSSFVVCLLEIKWEEKGSSDPTGTASSNKRKVVQHQPHCLHPLFHLRFVHVQSQPVSHQPATIEMKRNLI